MQKDFPESHPQHVQTCTSHCSTTSLCLRAYTCNTVHQQLSVGGCRDTEQATFHSLVLNNMTVNLMMLSKCHEVSSIVLMLCYLLSCPMTPALLLKSQVVKAVRPLKQVCQAVCYGTCALHSTLANCLSYSSQTSTNFAPQQHACRPVS